MRLNYLLIAVSIQGILSLICLTLQIKLYIYVRSLLLYSPADRKETMELDVFHITNSSTVPVNNPRQGSSARRLNKLELRTTRILCIGIFPFCLVTLTLCLVTVVLIVYRSQGLEVFWIVIFIMKVFREVLLVHLLYIPIAYIIHSREFLAAGRRFCRTRRPISQASDFD